MLSQQRRIEKAEQDTSCSHQHHLPASKADQRQTDKTSQRRRHHQATPHGRQRHPPLCTRPFRTKTRLAIILPSDAVEIVVHKVGIHLHHHRKEETQECRHERHTVPVSRHRCHKPLPSHIMDGQGHTNHHGHGSPRQRLRTRCQQKSLAAIDGYMVLIHYRYRWTFLISAGKTNGSDLSFLIN